MALFLFIVFAAPALFQLRTYVDRVYPLTPRCEACRYSLQGLPDEGLCPECGARYRPYRFRHVEHLVMRRAILPYLLFALAVLVLVEALALPEWLYAWGTIRSYLEDGFRMDIAINAAFKRELRDGGGDAVMWPARWWLACSPLLVLFLKGGRRYATLILVELALLGLVLWAGLLVP